LGGDFAPAVAPVPLTGLVVDSEVVFVDRVFGVEGDELPV
jgi:hypothetical protein